MKVWVTFITEQADYNKYYWTISSISDTPIEEDSFTLDIDGLIKFPHTPTTNPYSIFKPYNAMIQPRCGYRGYFKNVIYKKGVPVEIKFMQEADFYTDKYPQVIIFTKNGVEYPGNFDKQEVINHFKFKEVLQ